MSADEIMQLRTPVRQLEDREDIRGAWSTDTAEPWTTATGTC